MKDYFSHDYNSRNDKKLVRAGMKFDLCTAIGAYWCIVEMLYEEGGYLLLSEYERITYELRCSNELVIFLLKDSDLFKNDGVKFWSETAIERLKLRASKSQKARESIEKRWVKHVDTNVLPTKNDRNTSKVKESKVKESKEYRDKPKKFDFKESLLELGVDDKIASDWMEVRRTKKASNTETAFKAIKAQVELSGVGANECVRIAAEKSWQGLKAEWITNELKKNDNGNTGFKNSTNIGNSKPIFANDESIFCGLQRD